MSSENDLEVLVTGGSGFLGRSIVKALLDKHPEWIVSTLDANPPAVELHGLVRQHIQADITSVESVTKAFVDYSPDVVVHTAGIVPARKFRYSTNKEDWETVKAVNYYGTKHILDAAMASGCRYFVHTSSCTAITDDVDHDYFLMDESVPLGLATLTYGKSKGLAEQYVMSPKHAENGLLACALRPCTIIGPGDTAVISVFYDLIGKHETYFIVGEGDNLYDFMYIDNAVVAHVLAIENLLTTKTAAGEVFFISNQEPVYFWDFMAYIWAQFGHVPKFRIKIPTSIAWAASYVLELYTWITGAASTLDRGSIKDGIRTQYSENSKAYRILGYEPKVGLAEGVRLACDDYKRYLAAHASSSGTENGVK